MSFTTYILNHLILGNTARVQIPKSGVSTSSGVTLPIIVDFAWRPWKPSSRASQDLVRSVPFPILAAAAAAESAWTPMKQPAKVRKAGKSDSKSQV